MAFVPVGISPLNTKAGLTFPVKTCFRAHGPRVLELYRSDIKINVVYCTGSMVSMYTIELRSWHQQQIHRSLRRQSENDDPCKWTGHSFRCCSYSPSFFSPIHKWLQYFNNLITTIIFSWQCIQRQKRSLLLVWLY